MREDDLEVKRTDALVSIAESLKKLSTEPFGLVDSCEKIANELEYIRGIVEKNQKIAKEHSDL